MKKERRIPTILGLFFVILLVVGLGIGRRQIFLSKADQQITPSDVRITNITDNSFTVSWITAKEASGLVKLLTEEGERIFPDVRDRTGELSQFNTHYVEVVGLEGNKSYRFMIVSGGKEFFSSDNNFYRVKTALPLSGELPRANLASGRVETADGQPAEGAIVYLAIEGISPLSSLVTSQGNWVISLAKAFSSDLTGLANYQEGKIIEEILVQGGRLGTATARVYTENDDPVPPIILGRQHDFTQKDQESSNSISRQTTTSSEEESRLGGVEADERSIEKAFAILNPEEGETISFPRPEIFGTGPRGARIKIILESPTKYEAEIEIDNSGDWRWTPPQDLTPGAHTLKITYVDPQTGQEETFVRSFVLAANDTETPSFTATPSGEMLSPTPTLTPTPAPTITPSATPTATPTTSLPPRTSQPSTESGVPQSGFWEPILILISGGIIFILGTVLLLF